MAKSTQTEVQQRVEQVLQMHLLGSDFAKIRQYASAQGWSLSDRQLYRYLEQANDLLKEQVEQDRARLMARHLGQRRALYGLAVAAGDYKAALAALKDEAALLDLYPAKTNRTELTGRDGAPLPVLDISESERAALVAGFLARNGWTVTRPGGGTIPMESRQASNGELHRPGPADPFLLDQDDSGVEPFDL